MSGARFEFYDTVSIPTHFCELASIPALDLTPVKIR